MQKTDILLPTTSKIVLSYPWSSGIIRSNHHSIDKGRKILYYTGYTTSKNKCYLGITFIKGRRIAFHYVAF